MASCQPTIVKLDEFPNVDDLRGANSKEVVINAGEDLDMLRQGKAPIHSTYTTGLYDGGTRFFAGVGYRIIDYKRFTTMDGVGGKIIGQSIIFERDATGGCEQEYSNAKFIIKN